MGRLRISDVPAGVGGAILLASLLGSGLSIADILLAGVAAVAIALTIAAAGARGPALLVALGVLTTVFGLLGALLCLIAGSVLGLAGALTVFVGGLLSLKDESTPGAVAPDLPRRPAPSGGLDSSGDAEP